MSGKLIFIVDDDINIRKGYCRVISSADRNFRVHTYECPGDLLAALDEGQEPDLILTDNDMAGMTGAELTRHLRRNGFTKPIVMSSGSFEAQKDSELCKMLDGFLPKPSSIAEILATIERALDK